MEEFSPRDAGAAAWADALHSGGGVAAGAHDADCRADGSAAETCVVVRMWLPRGCDARDDASAYGALLVAARVQGVRAARWLERSRVDAGDAAAAERALQCASAAYDALRAADGGRVRLGPDHVLRIDTDLILFDALCAVAPRRSVGDERARWQRAAGAGERVAASFARVLPLGVWPQRALHWYRLAKVRFLLFIVKFYANHANNLTCSP